MKEKRPNKKRQRPEMIALDALVEEITIDANGEDEQLWAFRQAFEDEVALPANGTVGDEPVSVLAFDYDGNERRGLTARVRSVNSKEHVIAAADVAMTDTKAANYVAAYRLWMGIDPFPVVAKTRRRVAPRRVAEAKLDISRPVELIVVSMTRKVARCRVLGTDLDITLRATRLWDVVPGEIATIRPAKQWTYAGHAYISGKIESVRLDAGALGLVPLKLEDRGLWKPAEEYWGEEGDPIDAWAKPIIARGPRPAYEMEQVLPGMDVDDPFSDPIGEANDHKEAGDFQGAYKILMDLCQSDLRCLDAHAHLGNLVFETLPKDAIRHFEVGIRIGELSLGEKFDGVLPWGWIDNRPFLRCMHGYGLCLWRLRKFADARKVFDKMLWLNPSDNTGVRFLIDEVARKVPWEKSKDR